MSTPEHRFWVATLLLLWSLQFGVQGFGINLMKVPAEDKGQEACILALLRKYFDSGDGLSGSVLCFNRNYQLPHIQDQLLRGMHTYRQYPWSLLITNSRQGFASSGILMNEKPQCYFLIVESLDDEDLDEIFEHWKSMVNWNPLAQFVVYLASLEETEEEMTDLMVELLLTFMNKKIFNVNVIGQSAENNFFYGKTVFPYHPDNNCGNRVISVELLDACDYPGDEKDVRDEEYDEGEGEGGENQEDNSQENSDDQEAKVPKNSRESGENGTDFREIGQSEGQDTEYQNNSEEKCKEECPQKKEGNEKSREQEEYVDEIHSNESGGQKESAESGITGHENNDGENYLNDDKPTNENRNINERNDKSLSDEEIEKNNKSPTKLDYYRDNSRNTRFYLSSDPNGNLKYQTDDEYSDSSNENVSNTSTKATKDDNTESSTETSTEDNVHKSPENGDNKSNFSEPEATIEEFYRAKFEDKFPHDLSGCPLTASFRPWEPYIFRNREEEVMEDYYYDIQADGDDYNDTSPSYGETEDESYGYPEEEGDNPIPDAETQSDEKVKLSGIEYQMVKTIAERLHVNIEMQGENSNLYHLFQQLIDGEIEMIVGGIDEDPSISQFVSSSIPYHQDELTWCVARAKRRHGFFNFVATFKADAGFLLGLFVVTCSLVVLVAQRVSGFRLGNLNGYFPICLRVLGILLNQSIAVQNFSLTLRQLFALSFLMGFFFSNTYQSFLISTLTTPRSSNQIQTLEDIYINRMTIMGTSENVRHLNKDGEIFKYIREKFKMCYNLVDCLNNAAENEHIAVAVSRQHSFYNPRIQRDRLYCFDRRESLYVYLVTMLLPKKYHLLHQINPVIQHIIESGHMQKWARDLDMRRMIHEEITRVREDPFKALTYDQFRGAIAFSAGLLLVASCVFAFEWCYVKCALRSKTKRLFLK
ncbi:uncharacterized protein LOC128266682 [Drosophila gunungcola]|uniref:uncharacterized protein LOC128266682 n=1 Tax=Drosophila gunungcola TaxID=103775 RepID=UPI0022E62E13|nr:uncharacterized protein LOC128266682 [Drosophila gunungcola]